MIRPEISDLQALYLNGTYFHKTGTRPPSCTMPQEPTINANQTNVLFLYFTEDNSEAPAKRTTTKNCPIK